MPECCTCGRKADVRFLDWWCSHCAADELGPLPAITYERRYET